MHKKVLQISKIRFLLSVLTISIPLICFPDTSQIELAYTPQYSQTLSLPEKQISRPISNYWQYILELHKKRYSFRETTSPSKISPRRFSFELFRDLKPIEFMRACREAVDSAKKEGKENNWTEQEIIGKSFENLSLVLEYYGLYIEKPSEVDILINAIAAEKEDPIIRLFLLKQLNSKPPHQSLFALHFKNIAKTRKEELLKNFFILIERINETPEILTETMSYLYDFLFDEYTEVLKNDSVIQAYSYTNKKEITPTILKCNDLPKPLDRTQAELSKLNRYINDFLNKLEKVSTLRNASIEKQSKKLIEMILNNFPIQNS